MSADLSEARPRGSVLEAVLLSLVLHVVGIPTLIFAAQNINTRDPYSGLVPLMFFGFFQWLYVGPALLVLWRLGRRATLKPMLVIALVVLSLNAACFGVFWVGSRL